MTDCNSGYDGEIDWEAEIIAADLAALQAVESGKRGKDDSKPNSGMRELKNSKLNLVKGDRKCTSRYLKD